MALCCTSLVQTGLHVTGNFATYQFMIKFISSFQACCTCGSVVLAACLLSSRLNVFLMIIIIIIISSSSSSSILNSIKFVYTYIYIYIIQVYYTKGLGEACLSWLAQGARERFLAGIYPDGAKGESEVREQQVGA